MEATEANMSASVLELVGEPKRVDILRTLVEYRRERPDEPIAFSELYERSNHEEKGNFNYHLNRLRGQFLEKDGGGYRLTSAGEIIAGAILSGAYDGPDRTLELGEPCPHCDTHLQVRVSSGWTEVSCAGSHTLLGSCLPPGIVEGRSPEEVFQLAIRHWQQVVEFSTSGACIKCYGREHGEFVECESDGGQFYHYETCCERCGHYYVVGPMSMLIRHPAVVSLCYDHGIDPFETPPWQLPFMDWESVTVHPEPPFRVEVAVGIGDDRIRFTLDRTGSILECVDER